MDRVAALLRGACEGRRFVCASEVLIGSANEAFRLRSLGAAVMAIGATRGSGELPADVEALCLDLPPATSMMDGIRRGLGALEHLPSDVQARVDTFDPDRTARVVLPFFGTANEIAGRRVLGARDPRWVALEDKPTIEAFWDRAGIVHAPSRIVPLSEIEDAHRAIDRGEGTVIAADNKLGWHGGGEYTRWAHTIEDARAIARDYERAADRVRVMPFLEGVPCSIHGIVFPDDVVALRPCEMMVLRDRGSRRFRYAQAATFWDPRPDDRDAMRALAKRAGEQLRKEVGYRGAFTIDGVMTTDGFRPTELNARLGAALVLMGRAFQGVPIGFLNLLVVEGLPIDWQPALLERELVEAADATRVAGGMVDVPRPLAPASFFVRRTADGWARTDPETKDAEIAIGPSPSGSLAFLRLVPDRLTKGQTVAPVICSLARWLDQELGLGLGDLEAAPDVRT